MTVRFFKPRFVGRKPKNVPPRGQKLPWYKPKSDASPEPRYDIMLPE